VSILSMEVYEQVTLGYRLQALGEVLLAENIQLKGTVVFFGFVLAEMRRNNVFL